VLDLAARAIAFGRDQGAGLRAKSASTLLYGALDRMNRSTAAADLSAASQAARAAAGRRRRPAADRAAEALAEAARLEAQEASTAA